MMLVTLFPEYEPHFGKLRSGRKKVTKRKTTDSETVVYRWTGDTYINIEDDFKARKARVSGEI